MDKINLQPKWKSYKNRANYHPSIPEEISPSRIYYLFDLYREDEMFENILLYCESGNVARDRLKTKMITTTHAEFANILTNCRY